MTTRECSKIAQEDPTTPQGCDNGEGKGGRKRNGQATDVAGKLRRPSTCQASRLAVGPSLHSSWVVGWTPLGCLL
eukprot:3790742-Pyramimonas_sp.AAC.1